MKQSQWTLALVLLVVMVFGVTFALQYLGDLRPKGTPQPTDGTEARELTFAMKAIGVPAKGDLLIEKEVGEKGYQDFWFVNNNEQAVNVWLKGESCKCAEVQVFLAPEEYKVRRSALLAGQLAASILNNLSPGYLLSGMGLVAAAEQDKPLAEAIKEVEGTKLTANKNSVKVPAGATGWVRLRWGDRQGSEVTTLSAELWMDQKGLGETKLEVGLHFLQPLRVRDAERERQLGVLNPRYWTAGKQELDIKFWSPTRKELKNVYPRLVSFRYKPEYDPFVLGQPQPLSEEEMTRFKEQLAEDELVRVLLQEKKERSTEELAQRKQKLLAIGEASKVRCAYRLPITIRDRSADGKVQLDMGPFRRQIKLSVDDPDKEQITLALTGSIEGDVIVGGSAEKGRIDFSDFASNIPQTRTIPLWTDIPGTRLEVDRERTARFLVVKIEEVKEPGSSYKHNWKVEVKIPAGAVEGPFPRDDEDLRDSALYLKTGSGGRTLRIPVIGRAGRQR